MLSTAVRWLVIHIFHVFHVLGSPPKNGKQKLSHIKCLKPNHWSLGPWFFAETSNKIFLKVCGGSWPCGHHSVIHWMVRWEILKLKRGPESNVAHGQVFRKQLWIGDIHVNPKWITKITVFILNGFHTATLHRFEMNCLSVLFGDTGGSDSHWCESIHAGEAMGLSKWQANSRLYTRPCTVVMLGGHLACACGWWSKMMQDVFVAMFLDWGTIHFNLFPG